MSNAQSSPGGDFITVATATVLVGLLGALVLVGRHWIRQRPDPPKIINPDDQVQPLVGIRFSYIVSTFVQECGGWEALEGLTTTEVVERFIQPLTLERKESYCDRLQREGNPAIGDTATAFVSHAHSYHFLDVLRALKHTLKHNTKDGVGSYIFLDLFCINQHCKAWTYQYLTNTFSSSIAKFGTTIMVLSPWNNPLPYTRTWCVYEAYCTLQTKSKFLVALTEADTKSFLNQIKQNPQAVYNKLLATIQSEQSQSFHPEDRDRIFEVIQRTVGFGQLDALLLEQYRDWVISTVRQAIPKCAINNNNHNKTELFMLSSALGLLLKEQGKLVASLQTLKECVSLSQRLFGIPSEAYLIALNNLALIHSDIEDLETAKRIYEDCLEKSQEFLRGNHPGMVQVMKGLALTYKRLGDYEKAAHMYETCLLKQQAILGRTHRDTLITMNNLGQVYRDQHKYHKAIPLFQDCIRKQGEALGRKDPATITTISNLGMVYCSQGKLELALTSFEHCLAVRESVLGPNHPDTLASVERLTKLYEERGEHDKAKKLWLAKGQRE